MKNYAFVIYSVYDHTKEWVTSILISYTGILDARYFIDLKTTIKGTRWQMHEADELTLLSINKVDQSIALDALNAQIIDWDEVINNQ